MHNESWCGKTQQERQAQAGDTCWAKANAEREAAAGKDGVAEANAEGETQAGKACEASKRRT